MFNTLKPLLWLPMVILLVGCPQPNETAKASTQATPFTGVVSATAMAQAAEIFGSRCAVCHGVKGEGDGAASAGLSPKPRNFTDKAWQNSISDAAIEKIIKYGGAAVGKSAAMPSNPDLSSKPEVVAGLRQFLRKLISE